MTDSRKSSKFTPGTTSRLIADSLASRGVAIVYDHVMRVKDGRRIPRRIARFKLHGVGFVIRGPQIYFEKEDGGIGPAIDGSAIKLFKQKDMVKSLLRLRGFSVPEGMTYGKGEEALARLYFSHALSMFPHGVCVKPVDGNMGKCIFVGVKSDAEFERAFQAVASQYGRVMIEEALQGEAYRFTTVQDKVLAVRIGRPQNIVGDGVSTIEQLVKKKRAARRAHPVYRTHPFPFGDEQIEFLRGQAFEAKDRPAEGQVVYLGSRSNSHAGADVVDCMDSVHPTYIELVRAAVSGMPDIVVCGVDMMIVDPVEPAGERNYAIIELNTGPGFAASSYPWEGKKRDVVGPLIDYLFNVAKERQVSD